MLYNTKGLVIKHIKYSETSIIATIYTEIFGMQSFFLNGVRSKKSKIKINTLQPLSCLDLVINHKEKRNLNRIKEVRLHPYHSIPNNVYKTSMVFFIAEILQKSIKEEEHNIDLYEFLESSIKFLDLQEDNFSNFHLLFLIKLSRFLGFYPQGVFGENSKYFDMQNGTFEKQREEHPHYLNEKESELLQKLLLTSFENLSQIHIGADQRRSLLANLITFYTLHLSFSQDIVSHKILEEALY